VCWGVYIAIVPVSCLALCVSFALSGGLSLVITGSVLGGVHSLFHKTGAAQHLGLVVVFCCAVGWCRCKQMRVACFLVVKRVLRA
jgi:hypothetical protein